MSVHVAHDLTTSCRGHGVAETAVFTTQPTGEEIRGRDAIAKHLAGFYHGALEARPVPTPTPFSLTVKVCSRHESWAGTQVLSPEFRPPAGTSMFRFVTCEVAGGLIERARIYLLVNVLLKQIT